MSDNINKLRVICPDCGSSDFKQIVNESYFRLVDGEGKITGSEDELERDIGFGQIICSVCEADCTEGFETIEIE